jgi:hypothetical protein
MTAHIPSEDKATFVDVYKTAVEMADRTSARRAVANSYFLTINTALAAVVGIVSAARRVGPSGPPSFDRFGLAVTSLAGIVLACVWWLLLRYYRRLNAAKFQVINGMEEQLPARPYTDEWAILHQAAVSGAAEGAVTRWWRRKVQHREATVVEQVVPFVFMAIYVALGIRVLLG